MRACTDFFDIDPGSHGVRHGSPPATVTAAREKAA